MKSHLLVSASQENAGVKSHICNHIERDIETKSFPGNFKLENISFPLILGASKNIKKLMPSLYYLISNEGFQLPCTKVVAESNFPSHCTVKNAS